MQKQQAVNSERSSYPAPNDSRVSINYIYDGVGDGAGLDCCDYGQKGGLLDFKNLKTHSLLVVTQS